MRRDSDLCLFDDLIESIRAVLAAVLLLSLPANLRSPVDGIVPLDTVDVHRPGALNGRLEDRRDRLGVNASLRKSG